MEEVIENIAKEVKEIKKNVPELLNNLPEILKKKYNLPKEIEELKKEMRALKKDGLQIVAEMNEYEKNKVSKKDEKYKAKLIEANKLARKVMGLKAKILQKENLLKNINLSLEVIDYREYDNLEEEYQRALESIHQREKEKAEKEEEKRKKKEDTKKEGIIEKAKKGIKNIWKNVPKIFSYIKTRFKGIKQKTQLYSVAQTVDLEVKEETVQNSEIVKSDEVGTNSVIEENNSIQMQEIKVDNTNGQIENNAQKSFEEKISSTNEIIDIAK